MDERTILVTPITDENRDALKWLAVAQMIDGRKCCFCGYEWNNRESVNEREPIAASDGAKDLACTVCWNAGKRLP